MVSEFIRNLVYREKLEEVTFYYGLNEWMNDDVEVVEMLT